MPRKIAVIRGYLTISDNVEVIYEKVVTRFGTSA